MADRFAALNPAEREILLLLAQGHTAKSIAARTGASLHSVNERLREARRKTGAGSSRELARMLAAAGQENRDDKIEVGGAPSAEPARRHVLAWRWIAMTFIALTAAAAYFLSSPAPQAAEAPRVVSFGTIDGGPIHAGKVTLELVFDRPMRRGSYSFVRIDKHAFPDCASTPRQSADGRRFLLDCTIVPGQKYGMGINVAPYRNFVGADDGLPAESSTLFFGAE